MAKILKDYAARSADWRKNLRINTRRTYFVIGSFIFIYLAIGILIDMYLVSTVNPQAPLSEIFFALMTFQVIPYATIITAAIAVISLLVTFSLHDRLILMGTEYHQITSESAKTIEEKQLYNVVEEMKIAAGLNYIPKVFIIEAEYMNAFASGYSEKSAMVAITRGLLEKLNRAELTAVMAHELSHIRHMDIKLTLMASVLSNLMLILVDILFYNAIFTRDGSERGKLYIFIIILRFILPFITVLLVLYLSRSREYMADAGCVELMRDNAPLASALLKINGDHKANREQYAYDYRHTAHENVRREAYIFDPVHAGINPISSIADVFSTHPDIKNRLRALGFKKRED